ncbi:hypothetical protein [Herbaspirillum hiltneri]|uniref:hypothetical protein n=1 Tax=Herbaspirillum hiltneri TaxID=341045 RepID=UPI00130E974C|nr:hypothetical protein [Herbaspirillum hiltneri]
MHPDYFRFASMATESASDKFAEFPAAPPKATAWRCLGASGFDKMLLLRRY